MKRFLCTFLLVSLLACSAFSAQLAEQTANNLDAIKVEQRQLRDDGATLVLGIDEPTWSIAGSENNPLEVVEFALSGLLGVEGNPAVPVTGAMFRIPARSGVVVEVIETEYTTYTDVDYAAFYGSGELDELGPPQEIIDQWYPGTLAEAGEPAIFGDFRVSNLLTYPIQVNTARREVRVYNRITVDIRYEGVDETNALEHWPTHISEARLPFYRQFMDWDDEELDEYVLYRGNVVVVMQDDGALWTLLEPWLEWKRQKGWTFEFLTDSDVNWSASSIRSALQDMWDDAEIKYDYIAIIGDDQGSWPVPAGSGGSGTSHGDHLYSCVAGNDNLADVGLGRISVENNTHLTAYEYKVFNYEKEPYMEETDWYLRGAVNRSDNHAGISKIIMLRWWRNIMLGQLGFTQVDTSWGIGNNIARNAINNGVIFYGARGYISTGLQCGDINSLTNDYKTPMVIDVTCYTGNWSGGDGINECYMRAGTAAVPRGGIGGMSMATSATRPDFNHVLSGAAGWALLRLQMPHMGDMMLAAKINGWKNYHGHDDGNLNSFNQWFNQMGDPTVLLYTGLPQEMDADVETEIEVGNNSYAVTVTDDEGPVEGAWVTFYKVDDDEEVIATKVTDENGEVILEIPVRYAGDATLTVTCQHYIPEIIDVEVNNPDARVGYVDVTYLDSGASGTDGDGDGIPEAGETVGLMITAKNFGTGTETGVSITGSVDDEWISDVSGEATINSLPSGGQQLASGVVLIEIESNAQNDWIVNLNLDIESDDGGWSDVLQMTIGAPDFALVDAAVSGTLNPGDTRNIDIDIMNVGADAFSGGTGTLISRDPYVHVINESDTYNGIAVNGSGSGTFSIQAHENALPGYSTTIKLAIDGTNGTTDTVMVPVTVGNRVSTDPAGPDRYGYFAFDNTDTAYEDYVPTYDWVEINPDVNGNDYDGTSFNLSDPSENSDEGTWVELPFTIQYYGHEFDTITVCTNGFIAMSDQSTVASNRNWTIPAPIGPNFMIAPYWDELRTTNNSDILYYHDQANGRFIVEWYEVTHGTGSPCTFQVIFYSQEARPTWTGDNDILFQYNEMYHYGGSAMSYDVPYWTTGIENGDQTDGILIAYWNDYAPGAATIAEGSAILFTTNIPQIVGHVRGQVTSLASGNPIAGAEVHTPDYLFEAVTDVNGNYFIENFVIGDWVLDVLADCYNDQYSIDISVVEAETLTVNLQMTHPEFDIGPEVVDDELVDDDEVTHTLTIRNPGDGVISFSTRVGYQDPEERPLVFDYSGVVQDGVDMIWEPMYSMALEDYESHHRGIAFDGEYFWVSGSNNYDQDGYNLLYQYTFDGQYLATFNQPVPSEARSPQGFYGLHWDGEYLYGADESIVYKMEFRKDQNEWEVVETYEFPVNPPFRYLTVDPETNTFYVGDYGTEIRVCHPDSADIIAEFGQDFHPRGAAWVADDPDGYNLYMVGRVMNDDFGQIVKVDPDNGNYMVIATFDNSFVPAGACITNAWNPQVWSLVSVLDGVDMDGIQLWNAGINERWMEIADPEGFIPGGDSLSYDITMYANQMSSRDYQMYIYFDHTACIEHNASVHVTLSIPNVIGEEENLEAMPLEWAFDGAYPNPFNPSTNIAFTLKEATSVQLRVYNLLGQQVTVLADRTMRAGQHQLTFDGHDLASGLYFIRFDAGPIHETRKVVLMK